MQCDQKVKINEVLKEVKFKQQTNRISHKNAGSSERCYNVGEPLKALH